MEIFLWCLVAFLLFIIFKIVNESEIGNGRLIKLKYMVSELQDKIEEIDDEIDALLDEVVDNHWIKDELTNIQLLIRDDKNYNGWITWEEYWKYYWNKFIENKEPFKGYYPNIGYSYEINTTDKKFMNNITNNNPTNKEKLTKIKSIIENNQSNIFTSFVLDFTTLNNKQKLSEFIELKELLNINKGTKKSIALDFDKFKEDNPEDYHKLLIKFDNKITELRNKKIPIWNQYLSTCMFKKAHYLVYSSDTTQLGGIENIDEKINNIEL